ncbi:MAG: hypothetical protein RJA70_1038 [Pseudomonadota bacterium]|jgi:hypothetical protein
MLSALRLRKQVTPTLGWRWAYATVGPEGSNHAITTIVGDDGSSQPERRGQRGAPKMFGSQAAGTARSDSDVDLGLLYAKPPRATLLDMPFEHQARLAARLDRRAHASRYVYVRHLRVRSTTCSTCHMPRWLTMRRFWRLAIPTWPARVARSGQPRTAATIVLMTECAVTT